VGSPRPPDFNTEKEQRKYVRAAFRIHKIRLEHEASDKLLYPAVRDFKQSLDYSSLAFIKNLLLRYLDENFQFRFEISDKMVDVLYDIQQYSQTIIERANKIAELQSEIEEKDNFLLEVMTRTHDLELDVRQLLHLRARIAEAMHEKDVLEEELVEVIEETMEGSPYGSEDDGS
jgi:hypothetical protein